MSIGTRSSYGPTGQHNQQKVAGYNVASLNRLSPQQMQLFQELLGGSLPGVQGGLGNLSRLASGDESQFSALEAPAMRQFAGLQGNIASRFSGAGVGARRSSGFQNTLGGAAADFAERLQSQRMGLQQNAIAQLLGLSRDLLGTQTHENFLVPKKRSGWESLLGGGLPVAGAALGGIFGGPAGALIGSNIGSSAGSAFL